MYAIVRLKAARNAWYWQVNLKRRGKPYFKRFYDLKHGGSKKALAAAVKWRNQLINKLPAFTVREFHEQKRSNNRSGVPGVHFLKKPKQPLGVWQAKVRFRNGRSITRTFSVRKFGKKEAFNRAVAARQKMLEGVDDRPYLSNTVARLVAPAESV